VNYKVFEDCWMVFGYELALRGSPCKNRPLEFLKIAEFLHTFYVEEVIHKMNKIIFSSTFRAVRENIQPRSCCIDLANARSIQQDILAINATSSSSYVFRLQYPEVIHCRIVPIQKLKRLLVFERRKPPNTVVLSEFKSSNLKVTRKFVKTSPWATRQGG
jgi:hypothetical protein